MDSATLHHDVMANAVYKNVRIDSCVPLLPSRSISASGVKRLKSHILNVWLDTGKKQSGFVETSSTVIVMPLEKGDTSFLTQYDEQRRRDGRASISSDSMNADWYGIIDGCHRHAAFMDIRDEFGGSWTDFMMKVTCLKRRISLSKCKQIQRAHHQLLDDAFRIETTMFDLLSGLRKIYDRLYNEQALHHRGSKPIEVKHQTVAELYDGVPHVKMDFTRQAVSVASRISLEALHAIGDVVNEERPRLCLQDPMVNTDGVQDEELIMKQFDCRVFRGFVKWTALRASTTFMNGVSKGQVEAQVNTIYRVRSWVAANNFRSAQACEVSRQFGLALLAQKESEKFLAYTGRSECPESMSMMRDDLFQSTKYDSFLETNRGNDIDMITPIIDCFSKIFPREYEAIEATRSSKETSAQARDEDISDIDTSPLYDDEVHSPRHHDDEVDCLKQTEKNKEEEFLLQQSVRHCESADTILLECGISLFNKTWPRYMRDDCNEEHHIVDLILTQAPVHLKKCSQKSASNMDDFSTSEKEDFAKAAKRCLRVGGYIFMVVTSDSFISWKASFQSVGLQVMCSPFVIVYDQGTLPDRRSVDFPKSDASFAVLARLPGKNSSGFKPRFESVHREEPFQGSPGFSSIRNVPRCVHKLRRLNGMMPLRSTELDVKLVASIMDLFAPDGGHVLDPFGGAFEVALAALQTRRKCIAIEKDIECFMHAISRIRISVTPHATLQDMSKFMHMYRKQSEFSLAFQNIDDKELQQQDSEVAETDEAISNSQSDCEHAPRDPGKSILSDDEDGLCTPTSVEIEHTPTLLNLSTTIGDAFVPSRTKRIKLSANVSTKKTLPGCAVQLLASGQLVGEATVLQAAMDAGGLEFVTHLHGTSLANYSKPGQDLIVITDLHIFQSSKKARYPYHCPGPEGSPCHLDDMHRHGLYAWDLNSMICKT